MAGHDRDGEDERALFERAMREVAPLQESASDGGGEGAPAFGKPPARRGARLGKASGRAKLRIEQDGDRIQGLIGGGDRKLLRRLRRGQIPVDHELDLHGFGLGEARGEVLRVLERAPARRWRCVRIVHGRALGSKSGPVLKRALPGWLEQASASVRIVAFTTAGPRLGGAGATLVLIAA